MQPVLVEPDVVTELVRHGHPDLVHEVVEVLGHQAQRHPVDGDPVGQRSGVLVALGERHALVEPEQVGVVGVLVALPVTASILLIIREIVVPKQDLKITPEG